MTPGPIGHDNLIDINRTSTIGHVISLFGFHYNLDLVRLVTVA